MHLIALHLHGSNNPLGISSSIDKIPFHPYFSYKDYVGFFLFFLILSFFVCFIPNFMGEPDNYIPGNPLVTPPSIEIYSILIFKNNKRYIKKYITTNNNNYGYIFINNKKQLISKSNLFNFINKIKLETKNNYNYNIDYNKIFQYFINGFFQAEGHIGGYFETIFKFRPILYVSQNSSEYSIKLFSLLSIIFDKQFE